MKYDNLTVCDIRLKLQVVDRDLWKSFDFRQELIWSTLSDTVDNELRVLSDASTYS